MRPTPMCHFSNFVCPALLNAVYNITDNSAPYGSFGVYGSGGNYFNTYNLAAFQAYFNIPNTTVGNLVGGNYGTKQHRPGFQWEYMREPSVDVQYLFSVAR